MTRTQFLAVVSGVLTGTVVYYSTGWSPANWVVADHAADMHWHRTDSAMAVKWFT